MKGLKLFTTLVAAVALVALPATALAKRHSHHGVSMARFHRWERHFHLGTQASVAGQDPDHDGLSNLAEFQDHTNPVNADTDGDGVGDGQEIADHTNPDNANSNDAQEISGTVVSFDGTTLVIQLPGDGAGTVSGVVNSMTEVECDNEQSDSNSGDTSTTSTTAQMSEDGGSSSGSEDGGSTSGSDSGSGDTSTTGSTTQSGSDDTNDQQASPPCTIAVGDSVHEAKFVSDSSGNTFTKVELNK